MGDEPPPPAPAVAELDPPCGRMNRYKLIGLPVVAEGQIEREISSEAPPDLAQGDLRDYVWFSYRDGFPPVAGQGSDRGWGCVHRSGQMMLMTTFRRHLQIRAEILVHLFMDLPTASFSIQRITDAGVKFGKPSGTWFAPSTFAHVTASLLADHLEDHEALFSKRPLQTYVAVDQTIERVPIRSASADGGVLVMVPFMFGMDTVNESNAKFMKQCLGSRWCTGIIGGTAKHALYLMGHNEEGDVAVCLDPHQVQPAFTSMPTLGKTRALPNARECYTNIRGLEPSSLICFYAGSAAEAESLLAFLTTAQLDGSSWPLFSVVDRATAVTETPPGADLAIDDEDEWVEL
eukprot:TRINITY_DN36860_c0_g1_i2.p1 TRINITY_DN36860_c0_g1~~TRINITY_DN36860_c0_g1_i2.p1  ORF type:complete len:347 (+),score=61.26 TRINITY_DN36860_c0_g1_i2:123-1163(+)